MKLPDFLHRATDPDTSGQRTPDRPETGPGPLRDYAALGDGRAVALVGRDGTVDWACVPSMDSPPLFDRLLDEGAGGHWTLRPRGEFESSQAYRENSNVLETTFRTSTGVVRVTDSLNSTLAGRLPWWELARRVEGVEGEVLMDTVLVFGTRADTVSPWLEPNPNGCLFHAGPVVGTMIHSDNVTRTCEEDRQIRAEMTLRPGDRAVLAALAVEDAPLAVPPLKDIDERIDVSDEAWKAWAKGLRHEGSHDALVRRSALALKLLWHSGTGAIAAAATTSLPERIGGDKNYDYRYAWVRDAGYTINAFLRLGVMPESQASFAWLMRRLRETGARVCYTLDGQPVPDVAELDLPGYKGSKPVVTGNLAGAQRQHGVYGDIFQTAARFVATGNVLDTTAATTLSRLADECADVWRLKDSGIWELEEEQHFTMSKVSAWQALDRAVEMAGRGHLPSTCVPRWTRERDRIAAWVQENCWSERKKAYTFHAGTERLDAGLALGVRFGFDGRERWLSTLDAIRRELAVGPFVYRYSGTDKEEGAFLACSFWLASGYALLGRREQGRQLLDELIGRLGGGAGLLAEMVDPRTDAFLGNMPQGLSHMALIHAVRTIDGDDWVERAEDGEAADEQPAEAEGVG